MKTPTFLLLALVLLSRLDSASSSVLNHLYGRCPITLTSIGQSPDTVAGRSELQCGLMCSRTDGCEGVTVCPVEDAGRMMCGLRDDATLVGECMPKQAVNHAHCHLLYRITGSPSPGSTDTVTPEITTKAVAETTELVCQNGGMPSGHRCNCPSPFAGLWCQHIMRDCRQGYLAGHSAEQGLYLIQPLGSPAPFKIKCGNGVTYPFWRTVAHDQVTWSSMTWDDAKRGFGDDLNTRNASTNFFIGLDRLHLLLGQAEYTIDLYNMYDNWSNKGRPNYHNITVGPESSNYRLSYSEFTISDGHVVDNGLAANSPIEFSTSDYDTNGCNASSPGWYGSDCRGYSMFADPPVWPVNGSDVALDLILMHLKRPSSFYED